jgi:glycosyltransferase involved in cell wall biosynthesis
MKVGFFCIKGLETFIDPIANQLEQSAKNGFKVNKYYMTNMQGIDQKIMDSDIVWFEWANDIPVNLTLHRAELLGRKKVIVRLHSYEALAQMHEQINWTVVDTIVFVSDHIRKYCNIDHPHQIVIENGIDLDKFQFVGSKQHGCDIAVSGLLSAKKGIMLMAHAFQSLPDNFRLHIVGEWQDERERVYFAHMLDAFEMRDRVYFYGKMEHNQIPNFLADKNYMLCTSPWESQNLSLCEAMATGMKPLVHNFWGATHVYAPEMIWTSFDDLNAMVDPESTYDSFSYRQYIKHRFNQIDKLKKINNLFQYLSAS